MIRRIALRLSAGPSVSKRTQPLGGFCKLCKVHFSSTSVSGQGDPALSRQSSYNDRRLDPQPYSGGGSDGRHQGSSSSFRPSYRNNTSVDRGGNYRDNRPRGNNFRQQGSGSNYANGGANRRPNGEQEWHHTGRQSSYSNRPTRPQYLNRYADRQGSSSRQVYEKGANGEYVPRHNKGHSPNWKDQPKPEGRPWVDFKTQAVLSSVIKKKEADLSEFLAGFEQTPTEIAEYAEKVRKERAQIKSCAPRPLAEYTMPTHSGVELVKAYLLEHKFLNTQQIWAMGTEGLKPPIQESMALHPNGAIRMKRVATMREGRRIWVPPRTAPFPEHPFRSVRFLKETLLASLEANGVIHKAPMTVPLESEEEKEQAIIEAERLNRRRNLAAANNNLPAPTLKMPATTKSIWGWMLGPKPETEWVPVIPKPSEKATEEDGEEVEGEEFSDGQSVEKQKEAKFTLKPRKSWVLREQAAKTDNPSLFADMITDEGAKDAERSVKTSGMRGAIPWGQPDIVNPFERARGMSWLEFKTNAISSPDHSRTASDASEEGYAGYGIQAAAREEAERSRQIAQRYSPERLRNPYPTFGSTEDTARAVDDYRNQMNASDSGAGQKQAPPLKRPTFKIATLEEVKAKEDWPVDEERWSWCVSQEFAYHRSKFIAAQETAERQYVRRQMLRTQRQRMREMKEEDQESGLDVVLKKEDRRYEAIESVRKYAELTGQDVSGWYEELQSEIGDVAPYRPVHQARGGAIPSNKNKPTSRFQPAGFPIN